MRLSRPSRRGAYIGFIGLGVLALGILAGLGYVEHRWGGAPARTAAQQAVLDEHRKLERRRGAIGVVAVAASTSAAH